MKTITQISLGLLLAIPVGHADPVYLNGVGQDAVLHANPDPVHFGWPQLNTPGLVISDSRGITSISIQAYFRAYDAFGTLLASPPTTFELYVYPVRDNNYSFFPVQNDLLICNTIVNRTNDDPGPDNPYAPTTQVSITMEDYSDGGPTPFSYALENLPGAETWQLGFSVLSYEAVPEPSTWLLLASGIGAIAVYNRKLNPRSI